MRWHSSLSVALLLQPWGLAAQDHGYAPRLPTVWLHDPRAPSSSFDSEQQFMDPEIARFVFSERLGISCFDTLGRVSDNTLELLNEYAGPSTALFSAERSQDIRSQVFVLIEGAEIRLDANRARGIRSFLLQTTPSYQENADLYDYFSYQASRLAAASSHKPSLGSATPSAQLIMALADAGCTEGNSQSHKSQHSDITMLHLKCDNVDHAALEAPLNAFIEAVVDQQISAILLSAPDSSVEEIGYRNVYGSLERATRSHQRREEAVLTEPAPTEKQASSSASKPQASATTSPSFPLTPQCYESKDSCQEETNNCTGHGECVVKAFGAGNETERIECYQCLCNRPEVVKTKEGSNKTTYFGGSACHKKDISVPFWILTLTSGSLIAIVGFGVSMLYAMGNVELPSVIGAGVSGPRAK